MQFSKRLGPDLDERNLCSPDITDRSGLEAQGMNIYNIVCVWETPDFKDTRRAL